MNAGLARLRFRKLLASARSGRLLQVLRGAPAASIEHDFLRSLEVGTVIDVGANVGQFSSWVQWRLPAASLISFEPYPDAAATFAKYVVGQQVVLHQCALGAEQVTKTLHVAGADDSSSLLPIGALQAELYPSTVEVGTIQVPVRRLDDLVSAGDLAGPTLLKIDVQGTELEVLEGATLLLPHIDWIYVECSFVELYVGQVLATEIIRFLDRAGFDLRGVHNVSHDAGRAIQADFLLGRRTPTSDP